MNKKELIKKYKELENGTFDIGALVVCQLILKDLEQLDEPQKVTIPQFVADWYENNKDYLEYNFQDWLKHLSEYRFSKNEQFGKWVNEPENNPAETLIKMKLFGYEVEKEKRYLVKIKGICGNHETLNCEKTFEKWLFSDREENSLYKIKHTRKELEDAGFSEVFNSPLFEVEEVE